MPWFSKDTLLVTKSGPLSALHVPLLIGKAICRLERMRRPKPEHFFALWCRIDNGTERRWVWCGWDIVLVRVSWGHNVFTEVESSWGDSSHVECLSSRGCVVGSLPRMVRKAP